MARIPDETIQAVRDRADIVGLIGRHVTLRQAGRNWKGLCPFHDEKTPSFNVHPERGIFHCFGCGAGGSAITFLMRFENLTFPEAVRSLGREVGIEVPEHGDSKEAGLVARIHAANERAQSLYRAALGEARGEAARRYLVDRGFDAETAARFGVGFAPDGWDVLVSVLRRDGIDTEVAERAGLVAPRQSGGHYDRLRGRVTFPIQDARGRVVGFGGRALAAEQEPKYLNTPESPAFRKREALYGLPDALEAIRRSGRAVVVEGYFDRIALARAGVEEALATCGTSLTEEHARQLRRRTREVVLLFDADAAGEKALERALETLLPAGLRVRAAELPPGEDPDDFLARHGADALRERVDAAVPALDIAIRRHARSARTPWEKADAVAAVVPLLARIPDRIERAEMARQLALATGTDPREVDATVRAAARDTGEPPPAIPVAPQHAGPEDRQLRGCLGLLLDHPGLATTVDREELLSLLPDGTWSPLFEAVLDGIAKDGRGDVSALADRLEPSLSSSLLALAAENRAPLEEPDAARALADILSWLRQRRLRDRKRSTTERLRSGADPKLLAEKQREIDEGRVLKTRGASWT